MAEKRQTEVTYIFIQYNLRTQDWLWTLEFVTIHQKAFDRLKNTAWFSNKWKPVSWEFTTLTTMTLDLKLDILWCPTAWHLNSNQICFKSCSVSVSLLQIRCFISHFFVCASCCQEAHGLFWHIFKWGKTACIHTPLY